MHAAGSSHPTIRPAAVLFDDEHATTANNARHLNRVAVLRDLTGARRCPRSRAKTSRCSRMPRDFTAAVATPARLDILIQRDSRLCDTWMLPHGR
jgi:hypothetical protein